MEREDQASAVLSKACRRRSRHRCGNAHESTQETTVVGSAGLESREGQVLYSNSLGSSSIITSCKVVSIARTYRHRFSSWPQHDICHSLQANSVSISPSCLSDFLPSSFVRYCHQHRQSNHRQAIYSGEGVTPQHTVARRRRYPSTYNAKQKALPFSIQWFCGEEFTLQHWEEKDLPFNIP